jgi:hypothetical protein
MVDDLPQLLPHSQETRSSPLCDLCPDICVSPQWGTQAGSPNGATPCVKVGGADRLKQAQSPGVDNMRCIPFAAIGIVDRALCPFGPDALTALDDAGSGGTRPVSS